MGNNSPQHAIPLGWHRLSDPFTLQELELIRKPTKPVPDNTPGPIYLCIFILDPKYRLDNTNPTSVGGSETNEVIRFFLIQISAGVHGLLPLCGDEVSTFGRGGGEVSLNVRLY